MDLKLRELDLKFIERHLDSYTHDAFQDLHIDIYESVPKPDLHKIFNQKFFKLVDIYKSF